MENLWIMPKKKKQIESVRFLFRSTRFSSFKRWTKNLNAKTEWKLEPVNQPASHLVSQQWQSLNKVTTRSTSSHFLCAINSPLFPVAAFADVIVIIVILNWVKPGRLQAVKSPCINKSYVLNIYHVLYREYCIFVVNMRCLGDNFTKNTHSSKIANNNNQQSPT